MPDRPHVRTDPAQRFGRPNVGGSDVVALADAVWVGESVEEVADEYGLRREDVLVACWWVGSYGTRSGRRRFRLWAMDVERKLWLRQYDVPDPPDAGETP